MEIDMLGIFPESETTVLPYGKKQETRTDILKKTEEGRARLRMEAIKYKARRDAALLTEEGRAKQKQVIERQKERRIRRREELSKTEEGRELIRVMKAGEALRARIRRQELATTKEGVLELMRRRQRANQRYRERMEKLNAGAKKDTLSEI